MPRIAVVGLLLGMLVSSVEAATDVQGQPHDLRLRLENASVREVLDALSSKFKLTYSLPVNLGRQLTGRYSGTLNQVLARILDGNDYIVEVSDDVIKVVISGGMFASVRAVVAPAGSPGESQTAPPAGAPASQLIARPEPRPSVPPLATYLIMSSVASGESTP